MPNPDSWQFEAIGTAWAIDTSRPLAVDERADVLACVERFDSAWSRFRSDSLVHEIAAAAGSWELPPEADRLLSFYAELHDLTDGAVSPLIGRTLSDLGYDATYSLVASGSPAAVPAWDSVAWDEPVLTTLEPVLLDVGAAGKGLLVDLISSIVARQVEHFTVDGSGDFFHRGAAPIRVALEHPRDLSAAIGVATLEPGLALCASATNRRAWGDELHHVLDARTGLPTRDIIATWVVAESCMWADGLSTALFLADPGRLVPRFDYEFVRVHASGRVEWSTQFPGEVFT